MEKSVQKQNQNQERIVSNYDAFERLTQQTPYGSSNPRKRPRASSFKQQMRAYQEHRSAARAEMIAVRTLKISHVDPATLPKPLTPAELREKYANGLIN